MDSHRLETVGYVQTAGKCGLIVLIRDKYMFSHERVNSKKTHGITWPIKSALQ